MRQRERKTDRNRWRTTGRDINRKTGRSSGKSLGVYCLQWNHERQHLKNGAKEICFTFVFIGWIIHRPYGMFIFVSFIVPSNLLQLRINSSNYVLFYLTEGHCATHVKKNIFCTIFRFHFAWFQMCVIFVVNSVLKWTQSIDWNWNILRLLSFLWFLLPFDNP